MDLWKMVKDSLGTSFNERDMADMVKSLRELARKAEALAYELEARLYPDGIPNPQASMPPGSLPPEACRCAFIHLGPCGGLDAWERAAREEGKDLPF